MIEMTTPRVIVGSDVLEIMSIAMYAEPLVIYRELVQNSADAIDAAIQTGVLKSDEGVVSIVFDPTTRTVTIRDNGSGLSNADFDAHMLSFGASRKRSTKFRGFRGIGRLAGLGHCKELLFRSKSVGDAYIAEARWDAGLVRELISQTDIISLESVAESSVRLSRVRTDDEPAHFFEVRLVGVRRFSDDRLFDRFRIAKFLSEVAPVPFVSEFTYGEEIRRELLRRAPLLELNLTVAGDRVFKPYRNEIEVRSERVARVSDIEYVELPTVDGETAAFGWIAHHDYLGAMRADSPGRGLRVRSGNLQIGDETLLAKSFPEERFNSWAIGELHIFDGRLRANARRDSFEPSVHVDNLYNQLAPYAAAVARRCRKQSKSRTTIRRTHSLASTLDNLEAALGKESSAFAVGVRRLIGERAVHQLAEIKASDESAWTPALRELEKRAKALARRRTGKRLSPKARGRLDALEWLYNRGEVELLAEAVAAFRGKP